MGMSISYTTYGCTMNQGDTEIIKALLDGEVKEGGLGSEGKDIAIINSCAVIGITQRKILRNIKALKEKGKKVIVTGCLPAIIRDELEIAGADSIIGARSLASFPGALISMNYGDFRQYLEADGLIKAGIPKKREPGIIARIPIAEGCLGACSYCCTRFARGRLRSFPAKAIVREVEEAIGQGYREIELTAQDTGVYGKDIGMRLPELLVRICNIPGDFRIRVGMMNPQFALEILEDLIESFNHEKVYKFIHVPVQSGDDRVLEDMNRGHSAEDFRKIAEGFRTEFPDITISTDIIVGYPTETREDFNKSLELIKDIRPDVLNITRYSPRPHTPAEKLKDTLERTKKERSRELARLKEEFGEKDNRRFIGKKMRVLIVENGKNGTMVGRADNYKQVIVEEGKLGEFIDGIITDSTSNYLLAL